MILSSLWRRILGMSDKPKVLDALGAATAAQGLLAASALQRTDIIYGSNANGQYWRVPDSSGSGGLQICTAARVAGSWTFPAEFSSNPVVLGTAIDATVGIIASYTSLSTSTVTLVTRDTNPPNVRTGHTTSWVAAGRYT